MTRRCCLPRHTDISLEDEYVHIHSWDAENRLMLNVAKSKELVFERPNLKHYVPPPPIMQIEQVQKVKLLGVLLVSTLSAYTHTDSIVATMNQRLRLLNQLGRQGLNIAGLTTTFLPWW